MTGGKKTYEPDWKPSKRVKDKSAARSVHSGGCFCVLNCGEKGSVHHIVPRSLGGDDVPANFVCLCGSGTTGHHGKVEARDAVTLDLLGIHIGLERHDTITYILGKFGEQEGRAWILRHLHLAL